MEAGRIGGLEEIEEGMVSEVTEMAIEIGREGGGLTEVDSMEVADASIPGEGAGTGEDAWCKILFCVSYFGLAISRCLGVFTQNACFK